MSFTLGIPTTGQSLGVTKNPIQQNFTSTFNTIAADHVNPNGSVPGRHNWVRLQSNTLLNTPGTGAAEWMIGNQLFSGTPQVYLRPPNGNTSGIDDLQLSGTYTEVVSGMNVVGASTPLLGGLILKTGTFTVTTAPIQAGFLFATLTGSAFPSRCMSLIFTPDFSGGGTVAGIYAYSALTNTGFTAIVPVNSPITFIAIGY